MEIKVYSKTGDPYSDMLKSLLQYNEIDFENIEVSNKPVLLQEISGQDKIVPVIDIDGKIFIGFDREQIREVLGLNKTKTAE